MLSPLTFLYAVVVPTEGKVTDGAPVSENEIVVFKSTDLPLGVYEVATAPNIFLLNSERCLIKFHAMNHFAKSDF